MAKKLTAKMVDEMLPTEKGKLIDRLYRAKKHRIVEEEYAISLRNGSRYRRLTRLISPLGKMVDEEKISLLAGVALSHLSVPEQIMVYQIVEAFGVHLSVEAAEMIKEQQGNLTVKKIEEILGSEVGECGSRDGIKLVLSRKTREMYFLGMNQSEITRKIEQALKSWYQNHEFSERLLLFDRLLKRGQLDYYVEQTH